jgi:hypothetical protein
MRRLPELVFSFLLGFASLLVIFLLSSDLAAHYEVCETTKEGAKQCATYGVGDFVLHEVNAYNGVITAIATGFIAWFTLSLRQATDGLWDASKDQLTHAQAEAASADFHRTTQYEQIVEQIEALKQSAAAAEDSVRETRRLVWTSESNAQRQLRAYVVAEAKGVNIYGPENEVSVSVRIIIKNTGQTPAHDLRIVSKTELLEHPIKMPFDFASISGPDPSAAVLGAGQLTESESQPEKPFDGNEMMVAKASESGSRIYTWGTVTYRDVFGHPRYTNFCSSFIFADSEAVAHASEHHNDAS